MCFTTSEYLKIRPTVQLRLFDENTAKVVKNLLSLVKLTEIMSLGIFYILMVNRSNMERAWNKQFSFLWEKKNILSYLLYSAAYNAFNLLNSLLQGIFKCHKTYSCAFSLFCLWTIFFIYVYCCFNNVLSESQFFDLVLWNSYLSTLPSV